MKDVESAVARLAAMYDEKFGGKPAGRYRIPQKLVRDMMGRRRLYEDDVRALARRLLEDGYVLVDMDSFFVIMSANSFVNYRRASKFAISPRDEETQADAGQAS